MGGYFRIRKIISESRVKITVFYLVLFLSLSYLTSCAPPAQPTNPPVQHADPFYNFNDDDYPLIHLPLIKPFKATRQDDGSSLWSVFSTYGPYVSVPNSQEEYIYG